MSTAGRMTTKLIDLAAANQCCVALPEESLVPVPVRCECPANNHFCRMARKAVSLLRLCASNAAAWLRLQMTYGEK